MIDRVMPELSRLAHRCGLQERWIDAHQQTRRVRTESLSKLLNALGLPCESAADISASHAALDASACQTDPLLVERAGHSLLLHGWRAGTAELVSEDRDEKRSVTLQAETGGARLHLPAEPGYYELRQSDSVSQRLAITPRAPDLAGLLGRRSPRIWGVMAQVYSLRQTHTDAVDRTWGFGDFATVERLANILAAAGADVLALNPLHAMFSANPAQCSPYSPSSRLFLNVLYGAPVHVFGASHIRPALAALSPMDWDALDQDDIIDWPRAAAAKLQILRWLHARFSRMDVALQRDYERFCSQHGQPLRDHAVFEALHTIHAPRNGQFENGSSRDLVWDDPRSQAVHAFAESHADEVDFHCFAQWVATTSLKRAQTEARRAGMGVGLLSDLAIGVSPAGSQVWSDPDCFLQGVSIGAPPDIHQPRGQSWALSALSPLEMRRRGYAPFIDVLRAALAHTGGTRIDHILGMKRLWLVPDGDSPADGAYLQLPGDALLGLVALEAWRHRSLVIGENLGTVPADFNERLHDHGIPGMNVLWFMRKSSAETAPFLTPGEWPVDAVALTTTHDLPTLTGWWHGTDIQQRQSAGRLSADKPAERLLQERQTDKAALWRCLGGESSAPEDAPVPALLKFVASAPCALTLAALEDIAGVDEAPNVPGTTSEFPNWQRRLPGDTLAAIASPSWRSRLHALRLGREDA